MRKITYKQNNIKRKRNAAKYILFAVAGVLAVSSVFMTIEAATSSVEVANLKDQQAKLALEKRDLEGTLVRSLSISDLEGKSGEMGYQKPASMVYISDFKEAVAKLP